MKTPHGKPRKKHIKRTDGLEVCLRLKIINLAEITLRYLSPRPLGKHLPRGLGIVLILVIYQLLDRPTEVIPKNGFVVVREPTPHMTFDSARQLDELPVSLI